MSPTGLPEREQESHSGRLTRFSLDRRVSVLVLFLTLLVVGVVAGLGIPLELVPRGFQQPFLRVVVPWRDAPAPEVEEKITLALEEELSTVRGLDGINSVSRTGMSRLSLRFKQGSDMDVAYREVRDRIERARGRFPDDADRVYIRKHDDTSIPVAIYGLAVDPGLNDIFNLIDKEVVLAFSRVDGVASVDVNGLEEKEILIELDRSKTQAAGLNIYDLARELSSDNFSLASGDVSDGAKKLMLRSVARYADLEELEGRLVGPSVRLRDIADIRYDEPEKRYRVRVNSKPAYAVVVFKEGQANTIEVSRRLGEVFAGFRDNPRLKDVEMVTLLNQGDVIIESLSTLLNSGIIGGLFAVAVLFAFLRRLRMTAIITLSIPVSIVVAVTAMYFAGETLNIISLLGLMICVGLLVDNSVVVAENIHRMHREGHSRRDACLRGAGEIALAITTATLTTVVVFLPVALLEGPAQFFLMRLALPITVALLASLLVALVFVPLSVYLTLPTRGAEGQSGRFGRFHAAVNRLLERLYDLTLGRAERFYVSALGFFLHRRVELGLALFLAFSATMAIGAKTIKVTDSQEDEKAGFELDVELPRATTLSEAEAYFAACETVLEAKKKELDLEGYFILHLATEGEVEGWFQNPRTNDLTPREVTKIIKEALPARPGVRIYTDEESEVDEEESKSTYVVSLTGDDHDQLESEAGRIEEYLLKIDGVLGLKKKADRPSEELALRVDRERARRHGVSPAVVAGVVGYALRGTSLPRHNADGKEIPVRVRFREDDRTGLDELESFLVPTAAGGALPISAVTDSRIVPSFNSIYRTNKRVTRIISLSLEEGREEETRLRLDRITARLELPEGTSIGASSGRQSFDSDVAALGFAAWMSMVFIYLLMGCLFESFILPLSILLTIPLAGIGVVLVHVISGLNIDFLGVVGSVLLIGVVVNNGIVLIDYLNRLREDGHERDEAVMLAAGRRFRPIMMTALTTIFGLLPLTVGDANSIGWSYKSFGLTLIGGMTTSTVLTLLVIPVFYTLFDDARDLLLAVLSRASRWRSRATAERR